MSLSFLAYPPAWALGCLVGVVTGLLPGIHVNVVAAVMVGLGAGLMALGVPPLAIAVFIVAVAVTHAFFDVLPSLFLGLPADEVFSLLPGHQMVREGQGVEAIRLSLHGSWWGLLLALAFGAVLAGLAATGFPLAKLTDEALKPYLAFVLAIISLVLLATEKRKLWALAIFLLAALHGILIFNSALFPNGPEATFNALFPALSGLFGLSGLLLSLGESNASLPQQEAQPPQLLQAKEAHTASLLGGIGGLVVGLLPGLGAANAATLFALGPKPKDGSDLHSGPRYLVTTSAINASDTFFGIAAIYFIGKARSGASVAIDRLLPTHALPQLLTLGASMLLAAWLARHLLLRHGLRLAQGITRLDYRRLTVGAIGLIVSLVALTTGPWGLVLLASTTLLGMVAPLAGVRRAQAMGLFLLPVILFFSGWQSPVVGLLRLESLTLPTAPTSLGSLLLSILGALATACAAYALTPQRSPTPKPIHPQD